MRAAEVPVPFLDELAFGIGSTVVCGGISFAMLFVAACFGRL
jgi:hypothetical protein